MRGKLIGIFICTLLLLSITIPVTANMDQYNILNKNFPVKTDITHRSYNFKSNTFGQKSLDIAVTNLVSDQVSIFLGDGTGSFNYNPHLLYQPDNIL